MYRMILSLVLCLSLLPVAAWGEDQTGRFGFGLEGGIMKYIGGENDYSSIDEIYGLNLRYGVHPNWSLQAHFQSGWFHPGGDAEDLLPAQDLSNIYSVRWQPRLDLVYHITPDRRTVPYLGLGMGALISKVKDMRGKDEFGNIWPGGSTMDGYEEDGDFRELSFVHVAVTASAGIEHYVTPSFAVGLAARYHFMEGNKRDNVGLSGPTVYNDVDHVDANNGIVEGVLGIAWNFGTRDADGDLIPDDLDSCPEEAEDFDGYKDDDGCPDLDNDGDGIADDADRCPNEAEDKDGYQDSDGCPDLDNDGDGVPDAKDGCPGKAEDKDGFQDADGCPDPDNDGDGVLDAADKCPDTPAGAEVDAEGCTKVKVIEKEKPKVIEIKKDTPLILKGVNFESGKAVLTPESSAVLDEVVASLKVNTDVKIEIAGHTDSQGSAETNQALSQNRANAVRDYLSTHGIAAARMTAVGFGETLPIANNQTAEGRATNRRVEIRRTN